MDSRIYVCTHKTFQPPADPLYHPLHVGRALSPDLGFLGDDTGSNISDKNRNWCELTGCYWIWKNISCDIVGICHYRRYFSAGDRLPDRPMLEDILSTHDIILPTDRPTPYASLREQYADIHHIRDMYMIRDILSESYPSYLDAFELVLNCNLFSLGNMLITRKNIYDAYCSWLFTILFAFENRTDIAHYDAYNTRIFGFLSERLLRVWVLNQRYRILELPVVETG